MLGDIAQHFRIANLTEPRATIDIPGLIFRHLPFAAR
jgi:hypothetical protein